MTKGRPCISPEARELRKQIGLRLFILISAAGYVTQAEFAEATKIRQGRISKILNGIDRIPSDDLVIWADALKVDRVEFCLDMMRFYDPEYYKCLRHFLEP